MTHPDWPIGSLGLPNSGPSAVQWSLSLIQPVASLGSLTHILQACDEHQSYIYKPKIRSGIGVTGTYTATWVVYVFVD